MTDALKRLLSIRPNPTGQGKISLIPKPPNMPKKVSQLGSPERLEEYFSIEWMNVKHAIGLSAALIAEVERLSHRAKGRSKEPKEVLYREAAQLSEEEISPRTPFLENAITIIAMAYDDFESLANIDWGNEYTDWKACAYWSLTKMTKEYYGTVTEMAAVHALDIITSCMTAGKPSGSRINYNLRKVFSYANNLVPDDVLDKLVMRWRFDDELTGYETNEGLRSAFAAEWDLEGPLSAINLIRMLEDSNSLTKL